MAGAVRSHRHAWDYASTGAATIAFVVGCWGAGERRG
jgi:hypothetical protein